METSDRVTRRFMAAQTPAKQKALDVLNKAGNLIDRMARWFAGYNSVRRNALQEDRTGLDDKYVWYDKFNEFWKDLTPIREVLRDFSDDELEEFIFDDAYPEGVRMAFDRLNFTLKRMIFEHLGEKASIGAIRDVEHAKHPDGSPGLAYPIKMVDAWADAFGRLIKEAEENVKRTTSLAKKVRK